MDGHTDSRGWAAAFAAGLLLRPLLIVPMAPSGPLAGSDLLPLAIAGLFAGSAGLAAGVWLGSRLFTALGILSAVVAPAIAVAGAWAGLPAPWPLLLAVYDGGLAVVGAMAWRAWQGTAADRR